MAGTFGRRRPGWNGPKVGKDEKAFEEEEEERGGDPRGIPKPPLYTRKRGERGGGGSCTPRRKFGVVTSGTRTKWVDGLD